MVDFKKRLGKITLEKKVNPLEIYDSLDRNIETGPLRPSQKHILEGWFKSHLKKKNLIIKLHTGEGKTLIGLLILQSKLNASEGPCLYICPNKYLVEQTCLEAEKFGIHHCKIPDNNYLPEDFLNGEKILITHVQKLFNGKTIFGLDSKSKKVKNIVLDDSHACIDWIQNSITIKIKRDHILYSRFLELFEEDLKEQGEGSLIDIKDGDYDALLPIPYWSWFDKKSEILEAISKSKEDKDIKFIWPLFKDNCENFQAFITGDRIEITPTFIPINRFGSFDKAHQRILMSATTQEDSFFIKGLGFDIETVNNPLTFNKLKWSGEKMILLPSIVDSELDRNFIVSRLAKPSAKNFGIISIVPNFNKSEDYKYYNAEVATATNIYSCVEKLKNKEFYNTLTIVNRYDGIDLPDNLCRILIIDSLPFYESLFERYGENCRPNSDIINMKIAQRIEQGLGRSVRGERDYSVIMIIGGDVVDFVKNPLTKKYFSLQTRKQIDIGLDIARFAKEDMDDGESPGNCINSLIKKLIGREADWKEYYKTRMSEIGEEARVDISQYLSIEREAESFFFRRDYEKACEKMQKLCDLFKADEDERGWYLQNLARYKYLLSKIESQKTQKSAYDNNLFLLKPKEGISYKKLNYINENRIKRIKEWISKHNSYEELMISIDGTLSHFSFSIAHEKFENSLKIIGEALGFLSQRPDKEYKKGPDNLWCTGDNRFIMFECKSEVKDKQSEISKRVAAQMNTHCEWFKNEYSNNNFQSILIIPTKDLAENADLNSDVKIMRKEKMNNLKKNIKGFFQEFKGYEINNLSDQKIQEFLSAHHLDISDFDSFYSEDFYHKRRLR